ncbi:MAG: acyl carrier protein [Candidatus Brocadiaceae bacterium]|nr:acyl carrier protein [Candidatus Brocadiaceae bacterium]
MEDAVKRIIVERCFLSIAPEEIGTEDDLLEAVGLDSVQILEVVVGLEEVFGVTFEDADFEIANFASVRAIVDYLRARGDR